ncbi:MAG: hypothetical protein VX340_10365, partial [Pseudomonadota bacterium]|nr:hypothetical protein [Pseudomonadota bacterium]
FSVTRQIIQPAMDRQQFIVNQALEELIINRAQAALPVLARQRLKDLDNLTTQNLLIIDHCNDRIFCQAVSNRLRTRGRRGQRGAKGDDENSCQCPNNHRSSLNRIGEDA